MCVVFDKKPAKTLRRIRTRPLTRRGCDSVLRPCPFVSCRYNLLLDRHGPEFLEQVNTWDVDTLGQESCALDVADSSRDATMNYGEISRIMGMNQDVVRNTVRDMSRLIIGIDECGGPDEPECE